MTRRNTRRNISRTTHKNGYKRTTMRYNLIHHLRNSILHIILLSILPQEPITHNRTRINMTANRNSMMLGFKFPLLPRMEGFWIWSTLNYSFLYKAYQGCSPEVKHMRCENDSLPQLMWRHRMCTAIPLLLLCASYNTLWSHLYLYYP